MPISMIHYWETHKDIEPEDKVKVLQWILDNDLAHRVDSVSLTLHSENENQSFREMYSEVLAKLLLKYEAEGRVKRCPECGAIPLHHRSLDWKRCELYCELCNYSEEVKT